MSSKISSNGASMILQVMQQIILPNHKKYGTPVLGPLIWLFSSVSVKNFTSLSYETTQNMNTYEPTEFTSRKQGH
jgi:hypothetical protein